MSALLFHIQYLQAICEIYFHIFHIHTGDIFSVWERETTDQHELQSKIIFICKHYVHTDDHIIIFTPRDILKHNVRGHNRNYKSYIKLLAAISSKAKVMLFTGKELVRLFQIVSHHFRTRGRLFMSGTMYPMTNMRSAS